MKVKFAGTNVSNDRCVFKARIKGYDYIYVCSDISPRCVTSLIVHRECFGHIKDIPYIYIALEELLQSVSLLFTSFSRQKG